MQIRLAKTKILLSCITILAPTALAENIGPSYKSLNFGVVVNNSDYQIYRSEKLGKKGLSKLQKHLRSKNLPFPKTIVYMNKNGYKFPFKFAIEQYEEREKYGFTYYHSFGEQRTYVDGHNPYYPSLDIDTKKTLSRKGRKYFSLRNDGVDGGMDNFLRVLNLVLDPKNQPVLFHCHGGMHRTGMVGLVLRYLQGGEWTEGNSWEKKDRNLNKAQYEYYKFNSLLFRHENLDFVEDFSYSPEFQKLADEYGSKLRK